MRKLKEMLRLHFEVGLSNREIARSLSVSHTTVSELLGRLQSAGMSWPLPQETGEAALEAVLFPGNTGKSRRRPEPDWARVHRELSRKGVTLQLLWFEYKESHPDGYQYSQFCERSRLFRGKLDVVMRQAHRAGEKAFMHHAGLEMPITDSSTGQQTLVPVFVATLGASSYTYAEATATEDLRSFIGAHCRAFGFFGGVTEVTVPDNTKTGVTRTCYYEPDLNPTCLDMATRYGTVVIPTRVASPREKPRVERQVGYVRESLWRGRLFMSLEHMNAETRRWCRQTAGLRIHGTTRRRPLELYEVSERRAMRELPAIPWEPAVWTHAKVAHDSYAQVAGALYTIPFRYRGSDLHVRLTKTRVEFFLGDVLVKTHARIPRGRQTDPNDLPPDRMAFYERTPQWCLRQAKDKGPNVFETVRQLLAVNTLTHLRQAQGVLRLGDRYGAPRLCQPRPQGPRLRRPQLPHGQEHPRTRPG